ncbi:hypothetical protein B0O80DRAFT_440580 [Mortierella sp. GBAus27b]|nr:hypothetical protein BGX31_006411 [Mortierella sp. GBA43]KAI8359572.1 hypothetical protein B0O80DRAFT_440580 [Mortierella sp. GBAus27b]
MLSHFCTHTFFTAFLALCFGIALCLSVHAESVIPNAFVDGQRHYIFGSLNNSKPNGYPAVVDLTVPWNTSSPAVKKLPNDNAVSFYATCTLLPNGNFFTLSLGSGCLYDVPTSSWTIEMTSLPLGHGFQVASDMETGLVYITSIGYNIIGVASGLLELDLTTKKVNKKALGLPIIESPYSGIWCPSLRSILYFMGNRTLYTYTPSKVGGSSDGWGTFETTGGSFADSVVVSCFVPAHNGSKMLLFLQYVLSKPSLIVHVLDVKTRTWTSGPVNSNYPSNGYVCSVSGDQLIAIGLSTNGKALPSDSVVYNIKSEKWVATYTPSPPEPTLPTQPDSNTDDQGNKKVIIIVVVTGVLLAIILTAIAAYIGATKRSKSRAQSTGPDGSPDSPDSKSDVATPGEVLAKGIFRLRNPVGGGINSKQETLDRPTKPRLSIFGKFGRSRQGSVGAQADAGHPHAIVEKSGIGRNVQEGSAGTRPISQHPHANVMDSISHHPQTIVMDAASQHPRANVMNTISQHPHANIMHSSKYNDKQELIDSTRSDSTMYILEAPRSDSTMYITEESRSTAVIHNDKAEWIEE